MDPVTPTPPKGSSFLILAAGALILFGLSRVQWKTPAVPAVENKSAAAMGELPPELQARMQKEMIESGVAAPPGFDYCVDPMAFTRACETSPMTLRYSGGPLGTCPNINICGAHTKPCIGLDGITYAMMDQYGTRYYPRPQLSAGTFVQNQWDQCYLQHTNVWGPSFPCAAVTHPMGGTQAPILRTLAQVPPGPQKNAWCNLFECTIPSCPSGIQPTKTVTPTVVPSRTPPCIPVTVVVTPTKTPHVGPAPTKKP